MHALDGCNPGTTAGRCRAREHLRASCAGARASGADVAGAPAARGTVRGDSRERWCRVRKGDGVVHELALIESVMEAVADRVGDQRVVRVRLEIGQLTGVSSDALRFGFEVCVRETSLAGAELEIVEIAGLARCRGCGAEQATRTFGAPCRCGSFDRELVRGDELRLVEVEVM